MMYSQVDGKPIGKVEVSISKSEVNNLLMGISKTTSRQEAVFR